ncbi:MAG: HAMP domain-containing histidine kinase, partial [Alphaproteobacteria bacterium]|nr:HAMP domain-containing histidine kinase [Alphaproteobacteria bacterium]
KRIAVEKKKTEELEFLNKIQQIKIGFQTEFTQFISQMAHDIASPLVSLEVFTKTCKNLNADQQYMLTGITSSIRDIADDLLKKYKYNKRELDFPTKQNVLVSLALSEVINQKRLQYNTKDVRISLSYDLSAKYSFINIDQSNFLRTISNLINNAVEACKEKHGIINVKLKVENNKAVIEISDNGKGMSEKMINQIMSDIPVESTKQNGCGLGLCQVMETARLYHGEINIISKREEGTKFTIAFPITEQPEWISKQINLYKHNIVMVLDNDTKTLPKEWKKILKDHIKHSNLHFFKESHAVNDFVDSLSRDEREKVFVLMSYNPMDSVSEDILNSVLQGGLMKQSVIMTSAYNDKQLQKFVAMAGGKMFPAQFLEDVKLKLKK